MVKSHEGIIGNGYWKPVKADTEPSSFNRATEWCGKAIRPSFLRDSDSTSARKRTAYLDGLRGFAALLVYWGHHELWAHDSEAILENVYGYDSQYYFVNLPGVRLFFSGGHLAVTIFFVLSGYVLSAKPLTYIQAGEQLSLGDNLSSALFRRWIRLHIPLICTTFLFMSSWHLFGYKTDTEAQSNFRDEVWNWYCEFKNFSFVFRTGGEPMFSYNFHTWSIPVEFRGSVAVYTALLAFSRCTRNARLWCEVGLVIYFMYIADGWSNAAFIAGMLLCDLELLYASRNIPETFKPLARFKHTIFYLMFFIALYLAGAPASSSDIHVLKNSPGWHYLSYLKPQAVYDYKWFYLFWAATFMVASIRHISWLKRFFETRFNQYLGRISYGFYLVHGPILWSLGDRIYAAVGWSREPHAVNMPEWINFLPITKAGPYGLEVSFLLPQLVLLPITLWSAEIVTVLFDEPSVRFAQWLYGKTLAPCVKA
ncbi:hypothetical protein LTR84_008088 [Exophiala bonariae]|uniref:Acyltransferase 3 domain-containing protein n=1 Tax=Exophiala bonariae TaxID=1690606 RepID=A0AAV9NPL6_9EURO|nr:hypothetical protein LTR84_008088 [Exophiala bonariae]